MAKKAKPAPDLSTEEKIKEAAKKSIYTEGIFRHPYPRYCRRGGA